MNSQRLWVVGIVVLVLAAIVNVGALNVAEGGFRDLRETAGWVRHTQRAQNLIEHLLRLAVDAETGQRGYLMTGRDTQLERFTKSRNEIPGVLKELRALTGDNPVQAAQLVTVGTELDTRLELLQAGIDLKRSGDEAGLAEYMQQRGGKIVMDSLRLSLTGMADEERFLYEQRFERFEHELDLARWGFYLVVGLNLLLLLLGAVALGQDARRRRKEAIEAQGRNAELARAVLERTAELTELSHFLQRVQEDERARLAREIHDELGGTLAAAKIDLQMLSNKLALDEVQQTRLARAMTAIDDAVQVKRRIIEDLRPSLLDNLGLAAALRWQCSEYSKRSGVPCRVELQDENLDLSPPYRIAIYRVVQESLTNITKHASAKNVAVSLLRDDGHWLLRIADDGVGLDPERRDSTAHGLLAMRERARALGGEFSARRGPAGGTIIEMRVPFEAMGSPGRVPGS
jgi:signal transduction histidine kinase